MDVNNDDENMKKNPTNPKVSPKNIDNDVEQLQNDEKQQRKTKKKCRHQSISIAANSIESNNHDNIININHNVTTNPQKLQQTRVVLSVDRKRSTPHVEIISNPVSSKYSSIISNADDDDDNDGTINANNINIDGRNLHNQRQQPLQINDIHCSCCHHQLELEKQCLTISDTTSIQQQQKQSSSQKHHHPTSLSTSEKHQTSSSFQRKDYRFNL